MITTYPSILHHRRSIRLKGYDYSQAGMYFVTICCQDLICRFGKIENGEMIINYFGKIAFDEWQNLSERFPNIVLDVFQIMPNHIHGIISIENIGAAVRAGLAPGQLPVANDKVGATLAVAQNDVSAATLAVAQNGNMCTQNDRAGASPAPTNDIAGYDRATARVAPTTVGNIVGAFKSLVANQCLNICKSQNEYMGKLWQRDYWDNIIRNEQEYQHIIEYIINNPKNWKNDKFYS